jgi:hypothetical protein
VQNIVRFRATGKPRRDTTNVVNAPPAEAKEPRKVQLRLGLFNIDQTARDLRLLSDAVDRARRIIAQAQKLGDEAMLQAVRQIFEETNRHLGAYVHTRK